MRYLKLLVCAALWSAQFAWGGLPAFDGKLARIQVLETSVVPAPAGTGAKETLRVVYLVSRQEGVAGSLALREPRDVLVNGRSYRELTRAEAGREFEPRTTVEDAAKLAETDPKLWPAGVDPKGKLVITVELSGVAIPAAAEVRSRLQLGFDRKTETSEFTFTVAK